MVLAQQLFQTLLQLHRRRVEVHGSLLVLGSCWPTIHPNRRTVLMIRNTEKTKEKA